VVIIGAGFGGLRAARALEQAPVDVILVDRNNYHLFQPLLYQVATAGLSTDEIAQPVRAILSRQANLAFRMADVRAVDFDARSVHTSAGPIPYDALILAAGGTTHFFGLQQLAQHAYGLKDLQNAEQIRNHLLHLFEEALYERDEQRLRGMLTFVVAGGGPTGVESAGAIAEMVRSILQRDYPGLDATKTRVILLEAAGRLLPAMPDDLAAYTLSSLEKLGVEVKLGAAVQDYEGKIVRLASGESIPASTLIWAAGVKAAPLFEALPVEKAAQGRVKVLSTLQIPAHPEVFVIGDAAHLPEPLPMIAPVAMQQGRHAAENILRLVAGEPLKDFVYRDPGLMATIGRSRAVAQIGPLKLRGLMAWLAWVVVHIFQLIGFRNRLLVLINWAWSYILYDRPVRMIDHKSRKEWSPDPQAKRI
jgi:NADH dehydrogenase